MESCACVPVLNQTSSVTSGSCETLARVRGAREKGGRSTSCVKDPEFEDCDPQVVTANCQAGDHRA